MPSMPALLEADAIDIDDLPATLREIVALVGLPAALTIVQHYGGVRLYLPREPKPDHLVARLIGFEALVRLCRHYDGLLRGIEIPRAQIALHAMRRREIRRQVELGKTHPEVARQLGVTERYVRKVLKERPIVSAQLDLLGQQ